MPEFTMVRKGKDLAIEPYDFARPIQLSKGFERNLSMVAESFAKLATLSLSSYLRMPIAVRAGEVQQLLFEEYTKDIANPSCINLLSLSPLKVPAILEIELSLVLTMIEKLLGGHFLGRDIEREFTSVENRISRLIVSKFLDDMQEALSRLLKVDATLSAIEHNPDFTYVMGAREPCLIMNFDLEVGEYQGKLNVCISLPSLDAELGGDGSAGFRDLRNKEEKDRDMERIQSVVDDTPVELIVEIGKVPISMDQLRDMEEGQLFRLNTVKQESLKVYVGDRQLYEGRMGRVYRKSALKIEKIMPAKLQD
jgi:flagellar motor switch protein FliM